MGGMPRLVSTAIISLLLVAISGPVLAADQTLLLEVHVNGYSIGSVGEFTLREGTLFARRKELGDLGFQVPASIGGGQDELIGLNQLPGLTWRFDEANQAIYVTAGTNQLVPAHLTAGAGSASKVQIQSGTGMTLDYDVSGDLAGGVRTTSGLFDLRGFSLWGVISSGFLFRAGTGKGYTAGTSLIRLDSTAQYSDVDTLRRYTIGDFITDGLNWTRPVRMAGGQIRSDFSMRPDLVTFPLPSVSGSAAVPSTLDVFANGIRLFSDHVAPGPFEVSQLPVVNGADTISTTLTDVLGNQIVSTMPFYTSPILLAPGLQTYSVQSGFVRRYWGVISNDYGGFAGSAVYRRGLTPELTIEATTESTGGMFMAGTGVAVNAFDFAVINAAASVSHGLGRTGKQVSLGIQYVGTIFSYAGSAIIADRSYLDIAAMNGDPAPTLQLTGNLGVTLGDYGSLGIAYARIDRTAVSNGIVGVPPDNARTYLTTGGISNLGQTQRSRLLSASYSIQMGNISAYATAYHEFADRGGNGLMLGLTIPLGSRSSVGADIGYNASGISGQVQSQQSAPSIGDWGYQAFVSGGGTPHEFGELEYNTRYSTYTAGVDQNGGETAFRLQAQGAFSLVEGTFFGSNTIPDSFAIVETGLPDIHVLNENRDAGTTNYRGMLIVPDLRAFEINHLAIDPNDVPPDATIDTAAREVRPQDRSGVVVEFPIKFSHGALLKLVDEAGLPIPVGGTVTLLATGMVYPVGYDGSAYVQGLAPRNEVLVERPDGQQCSATFDYVAMPREIPVIGPLNCRTSAP